MIRFTDPIDIALLNSLSQQVETLQRQVQKLQSESKLQNEDIANLQDTADILYQNTITFSWTGATGTISWNAGYVSDKQGNVIPIPAGSRAGLSASTAYWVAWNPVHQVMAFSTTLSTLIANKNNYTLAGYTTGTGAQTGTAGGGGTDPGGQGLPRKFDGVYS